MAFLYYGTSGDDDIDGTDTSFGDNFHLGQGGNDTAHGFGGTDGFFMLGTLNAADRLDGGDGYDHLYLNGDYSAGVTMDADTFVNIEALHLLGGFAYDLTSPASRAP